MGSLKYLHQEKVNTVDFVKQSESPLKILDGGVVKGIPLGDTGPIKLLVGGKVKAIGKIAEEYEIPYSYQTNGDTNIFLYQFKNLVNPPKSTNATTAYWWEYCCTKDFVFSTNRSNTSPYPWQIIKADKDSHILGSYGWINCSHLYAICTDDQYLYASYTVITKVGTTYIYTSYLIKLDWGLNLITSLEIGEYCTDSMAVDNDYIFSMQYISGTGNVLQKRSKTTLAVISQVAAEYFTAMCLDKDYIWCNGYDSGCILKYKKSDLSCVGTIGSGFIDPYDLWMNKEFIISEDYGNWDGPAYLRKYRISDGQLIQTLEPEVKFVAASNSQWNGPDFFVNYG